MENKITKKMRFEELKGILEELGKTELIAFVDHEIELIDKKAMKELTEQEKIQYIRYIPYCTIQENESVLPVFTIDKMCIHGKREKIIEYPLFGISAQERFNDGNYDVILHPEDC